MNKKFFCFFLFCLFVPSIVFSQEAVKVKIKGNQIIISAELSKSAEVQEVVKNLTQKGTVHSCVFLPDDKSIRYSCQTMKEELNTSKVDNSIWTPLVIAILAASPCPCGDEWTQLRKDSHYTVNTYGGYERGLTASASTIRW